LSFCRGRCLSRRTCAGHTHAPSIRGFSKPSTRDERCQSLVWSATYSRRTTQARDRGRPDHGCKVHGQEKAPTVARLEDPPSQSSRRYRIDRPVRRPYDLVSAVLRRSRRELLWLDVMEHPSAEWIAHQLTRGCGRGEPRRHIIRDRDGAYGEAFIRPLTATGLRDRRISARAASITS
jgi:hypothetical protein